MLTVNELLKATAARLINGNPSLTVRGVSIDSRTIANGELFVAIKGDNFDGHDFIAAAINKGAAGIIKNSEFSIDGVDKLKHIPILEVKDTIKALGDLACFWRSRFNIPVIAVTGSNGKTTTKELIAWILSAKFRVLKNQGTKNNHIGLPMTLLSLRPQDKIAVLEMGTNHFGEISYLAKIARPNIGVITNIGPAHLEYFKDLKGVLKEKYSLIKYLEEPRLVLLNADDLLLGNKIAKAAKEPFILSFGIEKRADFKASLLKNSNAKIDFLVNSKRKNKKITLKLLGLHNIYNALAAISLGRIFGLSYQEIARRISSFDLPEGRLKFTKLKNINFIDDTYNSNPFSLKQALITLDNFVTRGRKVFVMGDMLELGEGDKIFHLYAGKEVAGICDKFIAVGELSRLAAEEARARGFNSKDIFICNTIEEARDILFNRISLNKEDVVLIKGSRKMSLEKIFK